MTERVDETIMEKRVKKAIQHKIQDEQSGFRNDHSVHFHASGVSMYQKEKPSRRAWVRKK